MGNIVGKQFGVVASKDYNTALTESVKEGNQGKFYLTENGGKGFNDITATTDDSRNTLIVNGNVLRGISKADAEKLAILSTNTEGNNVTQETVLGLLQLSTVNKGRLTLNSQTEESNTKKLSISGQNDSIPNAVDIDLGYCISAANDDIGLDVNYLSGVTSDKNDYFYSKGGFYFAETTRSNQQQLNSHTNTSSDETTRYLKLRYGTGIAFQEGFATSTSRTDGCYYINIDNKTIKVNSDKKLYIPISSDHFRYNSKNELEFKIPTLGSAVTEATLSQPDLYFLKISSNSGLCIDTNLLKQFIKQVMSVQ